jgi:glycosyltransferase involved in cell wall biosynthesis
MCSFDPSGRATAILTHSHALYVSDGTLPVGFAPLVRYVSQLLEQSVMSVSIVVPIFNEVENIQLLYDSIDAVVRNLDREYEILFVDDGSNDGSNREMRRLAADDPHLKIIEFRGNFGQTAAMCAGIQEATCDVVITMDGDLQNDPTDIPMMLDKIDEGFDLVHGWRKNRQDTFINRRLPSILANKLIATVTRFPVHDLGCTLKAIRREVAAEIPLYGEMHRFIPILAHWRGARCAEVVTKHHPRRFGTTKYGMSRTLRVLLDLITVKFLIRYLESPMRLFGGLGLISGTVGTLAGVATIAMKLFGQIDMTGNPLLLLAVFSTLVGVQFFVLGMLGELGARIYYGMDNRPTYAVRHRVNFEANHDAADTVPQRRAA